MLSGSMAVDANSNSSRLWSLTKPTKTVVTYLKTKVTGFYSTMDVTCLNFLKTIKRKTLSCFWRK